MRALMVRGGALHSVSPEGKHRDRTGQAGGPCRGLLTPPPIGLAGLGTGDTVLLCQRGVAAGLWEGGQEGNPHANGNPMTLRHDSSSGGRSV